MEPRSYRATRGPQGYAFTAVVAAGLGVFLSVTGCETEDPVRRRPFGGAVREAASVAGRSATRRVHAILINGGDRPDRNYQSHDLHVRELTELLIARGVPPRNIVVFASDGTDPAPDLAVLDRNSDRYFWLLRGTELGARLRPEVRLVNSEANGVRRLPATRAALGRWFEVKARRLRPGAVLLLYATDHGRKNPADLTNNALLLWGERLDVKGLDDLLRTVPSGVRTVLLMSQCFSGSFAHLLYGDSTVAAQGDLCGFFSSPADRFAYGCYPENRGKENVGHSFEFIDAVRSQSAFDRAHDRVLLTDDTPDVPNRTSGHWLRTLLQMRASTYAVPYERFADSFVEKGWVDDAFYAPIFARIDELGRRFGASAPRTLAELRERTESMPKIRDELRSYARRWDAAFRALKEANVSRFLEATPRWKDRLEASGFDPSVPADRRSLLHDLARFTSADRVTFDRLRALRSMAREAEAGAYRMDVRVAVALRIHDLLERVAGEVFLDSYGSAAERSMYESLLACEGFALGAPVGAAGRLARTPSFPPLDEELRVLAAVLPGWIGVRFEAVQGPLRKGLGVQDGAVAVTATEPDSPAALAGMSAGDVILGPPGDHFREPQQIREWVMTSIPGQTRELEILRGLVVRTVSVRIAAPPEHSDRGSGS